MVPGQGGARGHSSPPPQSTSQPPPPLQLPQQQTSQLSSATSHKNSHQIHFSLAPHSVTTTIVTTTTTKITEFPPLAINAPSIPPNLDPSLFPLAHTPTPPALKKFCFDLNGVPTRFKELDVFEESISRNSVAASAATVTSQHFGTPTTSNHLRRHFSNAAILGKDVPQSDQQWTIGRKRTRDYEASDSPAIGEGVAHAVGHDSRAAPPFSPRTPQPPARGPSAVPLTPFPDAINATNPLSPTEHSPIHSRNLPSPTMSLTMANISGASSNNLYAQGNGASRFSPAYQRLTPDPPGEEAARPPVPISLSDLPQMISSFDALPHPLQSYVLLQLLRRCPSNTLQFISSLILPTLKRDFLGLLPIELVFHILEYLDLRALGRCAAVSKRWQRVVEGEGAEIAVWKSRIVREGWFDPAEVRTELVKQARHLKVLDDVFVAEGIDHAAAAKSSETRGAAPGPEDTNSDDGFGFGVRSSSQPPNIATAGRRPQQRSPVVISTNDAPLLTKTSASYTGASVETGDTDQQPRKRPKSGRSTKEKSSVPEDPDGVVFSAKGKAHSSTLSVSNMSPSTINSYRVTIPHLYKNLYRRHHIMRQNWLYGRCKTISFPGHGVHVVTCLQFDNDKIVSGSDDMTIHIYDTNTGQLRRRLIGHEGGVWALQYWNDSLVSGSTDRTVRVWDMDSGRCTHLFEGHTSTVRCLMIVPPSTVDSTGAPADPPHPLIVTGSRDATLRVWRLPNPKSDEPHLPPPGGSASPPSPNSSSGNPYFMHVLNGHTQSVRAIAGHGRVLVSGSYDCSVRVWDLVTGESVHVFRGHLEKVYSVGYCHELRRAVSGSMDSSVRVWCTRTGIALFHLEGHTSLVGLLELSPKYLVSAAADATLRIWSPTTGQCLGTLTGHRAAITCFHHDPKLNRIVSGSDGGVKVWELSSAGPSGAISNLPFGGGNPTVSGGAGPGFAFLQGPNGPQPVHGRFVRDLVSQIQGVWRVRIDERRLVCALQREGGRTWFEVLDFGEGVEAGSRVEGPGDGGWNGGGGGGGGNGGGGGGDGDPGAGDGENGNDMDVDDDGGEDGDDGDDEDGDDDPNGGGAGTDLGAGSGGAPAETSDYGSHDASQHHFVMPYHPQTASTSTMAPLVGSSATRLGEVAPPYSDQGSSHRHQHHHSGSAGPASSSSSAAYFAHVTGGASSAALRQALRRVARSSNSGTRRLTNVSLPSQTASSSSRRLAAAVASAVAQHQQQATSSRSSSILIPPPAMTTSSRHHNHSLAVAGLSNPFDASELPAGASTSSSAPSSSRQRQSQQQPQRRGFRSGASNPPRSADHPSSSTSHLTTRHTSRPTDGEYPTRRMSSRSSAAVAANDMAHPTATVPEEELEDIDNHHQRGDEDAHDE